MYQRLPPLKALHAFEAAARHASFSDAANELSLSQGAISYQVKKLESSLGTLLFHRLTRRVVLTDAGQRLYKVVHRMFIELDDEIRQISPRSQQARLTIAVSTYFVTRWLSSRLGEFINSNPEVTVLLQHSVNDPGFMVEDVDLAIRWGDGHWPDCESVPLIEMPMIAVCSPSLLEREPGIRKPEDLRTQALLRDQPGIDRWQEWFCAAGLEWQDSEPDAVIVDPNVRVQSAIDGHGIVLANPLVQPEIDSGLLVEPFDIRLDGFGYYLLFGRQTPKRAASGLFHEWLLGQAGIS